MKTESRLGYAIHFRLIDLVCNMLKNGRGERIEIRPPLSQTNRLINLIELASHHSFAKKQNFSSDNVHGTLLYPTLKLTTIH
jgi:hypothetical protein